MTMVEYKEKVDLSAVQEEFQTVVTAGMRVLVGLAGMMRTVQEGVVTRNGGAVVAWDAAATRGAPDAAGGAVAAAGALCSVLSGSAYCHVTSDGACVTDGVGSHGNNERCTVRATQALIATLPDEYVVKGVHGAGMVVLVKGETARSVLT